MTEQRVDAVVIGMGPGGEEVAGRLAEAGLTVIGVERELVGGECPYWGCVPSKMMIRGSTLIAETPQSRRLRRHLLDRARLGPVARRIRAEATDDWDDKVAADRFEGKGGRLVRGSAVLDGPGRVRIGDDTFVASKAVVVASGRPPSYRRSTGWPIRRTGPTARRSRRPARPTRSSSSAAGRSASSSPRCSRATARPSRSSRPPTASCAPEEPEASAVVADGAARGRDHRAYGRQGGARLAGGDHDHGPARGRYVGQRQRAARQRRTAGPGRRARRRLGRPRPGCARPGGRRADARGGAAVGGRRRHRGRQLHAHGDVPGDHRDPRHPRRLRARPPTTPGWRG